ncbi:MAG: hypothetical protein JSV69_09785 [Chloroflexota bacterium]|nr:MAG: hypothetical protein JSV69_09785 [Chloroflexota bacterium]
MQVSKRKVGLAFIILGIIFFLAFQIFHPQIITLLESSISADGEITPGGVRQLNYVFYIFTGLLVLSGYGLIKAEDESWRQRMVRIFFSDPVFGISDVRPSPRFMLIASTVIGLFLIIHIRLYDPSSQIFEVLYLEDGIFESLTPILMLAAVLLIGLAIPRLRRDPQFINIRNLITVIYLFLMLAFLLNAMEEISWGQRIFGWETPQTFEGNIQNETNLHNYFNQYYLLFYRLLVFFPIFIFIAIWLEMKERYLDFSRLVLPHPSMIGLSLLIAVVSLVWFKSQELLEEMFAVFFMFYSFRIFNCFRVRGKSAELGQEQREQSEKESVEAAG